LTANVTKLDPDDVFTIDDQYVEDEAIAKGELVVEHMTGADMVADGLTKPLIGTNHEKLMQLIGLENV
jgi:hypothetical protein